MVSHKLCPLCSNSKISLYLKCTDHLLSKEEFELFRCSQCGFVFTREYPDAHDIGKYYETEDYISHDDRAEGVLNKIYRSARKVMLHRKKRSVENATGYKNGRILDIGCGTGYFAGTMKKGGWDVTGIEPNKKARDFGSRLFAIDVLSPDEISDLPDGSFDAVTMWHVLEHLNDPFKYAAEILRLLKPDGLFLAAVPNCSSYDAEYYGKFWAAYDVPRHIWHFTTDTFRIFAEKTGFRISGIRTLPLDVFYISILSEKHKGTQFYFQKGLIKGTEFGFRSISDKSKSSSIIYMLKRG